MPSSCKHRSTTRKNRRNRMRGGHAEINDTSMLSPQLKSLEQGNQFANATRNMHGGMGSYPGSVEGSSLPSSLMASARLSGLNDSFNAIKGMQDGGKRSRSRKSSRKSRRSSRKVRKSRRSSRKVRKASRKSRRSSVGGRKRTRKNRRYSGGSRDLGYASLDAPNMLLDADATARAGLNPEWALAENPNSFTPGGN